MRMKIMVATIGIGVFGGSILISPLFDTITTGPKAKPVQMAERKAGISKRLQSMDTETRLAAAWEIAEIPWKKEVKGQIDGTIEPLLRTLHDKDAEVRIVSAMALRSIAESRKNTRLSEGMPLIQEAIEKEAEKDVRDELKLLKRQMRRSQANTASFY